VGPAHPPRHDVVALQICGTEMAADRAAVLTPELVTEEGRAPP